MKQPKTNDISVDDGVDLWNAVTETVRPLSSKKMPASRSVKSKPFISLKNKLTVTVNLPVHDVDLKPCHFEELNVGDVHFMDKKTAERFKKGKMPIAAKLDLHGFFLDDAFEVLKKFIYTQSKNGSRCVLIVTGKGLDGKSIIRAEFPSWMNHPDLRSLIVSFTTACPQDGGGGAFYVLLKRNR